MVTFLFEVSLASLLVVDCALHWLFFPKSWKQGLRKPWLVLYVLSLVLYFVDTLIETPFLSALRLRRFMRPVFLFQQSVTMRKLFKMLMNTALSVIVFFSLVFVLVWVFAVIGLLVLRSDIDRANSTNHTSCRSIEYSYEDDYFYNFKSAYLSLLVFISAENSPDIMVDYYKFSRYYFVYFWSYFTLIRYVFLALPFALFYAKVEDFLKESMQRSYTRLVVAVEAAFVLLSTPPNARSNTDRYVSKRNMADLLMELNATIPESGIDEEFISWPLFQTLIYSLVFEVPLVEANNGNTYKHLAGAASDASFLGSMSNSAMREEEEERDISVSDHEGLVVNEEEAAVSEVKSFHSSGYFSLSLNITTTFVTLIHALFLTFVVEEYDVSASTNLPLIVGTPLFSTIYMVLILLHILYIVRLLRSEKKRCIGEGKGSFLRILFCGKETATGYRQCLLGCRSYLFLMAKPAWLAIITVLGICYTVVASVEFAHKDEFSKLLMSLVKVANILELICFLWFLVFFPVFERLFSTVFKVLCILLPFAGIVVALYYEYALAGMMLFQNSTLLENETSHRANDTGTYEFLEYYSFNFHDFGAALVTLWNLEVGGEWHIFMEAFVCVTNDSVIIFFVSWWFLSSVVTVNIFYALVIQLTIKLWKKWTESGPCHPTEKQQVAETDTEYFELIKSKVYKIRRETVIQDVLRSRSIYHTRSWARLQDTFQGLCSQFMRYLRPTHPDMPSIIAGSTLEEVMWEEIKNPCLQQMKAELDDDLDLQLPT